jgi:hypothetical protein
MKLWHVEETSPDHTYDQFSEGLVIAESEDEAIALVIKKFDTYPGKKYGGITLSGKLVAREVDISGPSRILLADTHPG